MAKSKNINFRMTRNAVMWAIILFVLALLFLFLQIDAVANVVGEATGQSPDEVKDFGQDMFLLTAGIGLIVVGLKLAPFVPWLGVPIAVIGLVMAGFGAWGLWKRIEGNQPN